MPVAALWPLPEAAPSITITVDKAAGTISIVWNVPGAIKIVEDQRVNQTVTRLQVTASKS
jgi:hypothetical protein